MAEILEWSSQELQHNYDLYMIKALIEKVDKMQEEMKM